MEIMAKSLLTKHGKYYELNPYKIIQRLGEINDLLFYDFEEKGRNVKKIRDSIDDLIDDMYEQGQLPR